jgi:2-polyprenyl-3-methyl-5-hydroxy-6-metoxy-1,4-benzoquinol methylase
LTTGDVTQLQKTDFYAVPNEESAKDHLAQVAIYQNILRLFTERETRLMSEAVFLDFGAGRGYAALAAAAACRAAFACDYDLAPIHEVMRSLGDAAELPANFIAVSDLDTVVDRFDIVFMWHVLEHLPEPSSFWQGRKRQLQPNASFFIQVPMFRPAHVINAHFVFFTEPSLTRWAHEIGAEVIHFDYDVPRGFISFHARMKYATNGAGGR